MADATTPAPTPAPAPTPTPTPAPVSTTATTALVGEVVQDEALAKAAVAAYKKDGVGGLATAVSGDVGELENLYKGVQAAIPEIKAGYKTTEFWLTVSVVAGNAIYVAVTGHAFPLEANAVIVAVTTIYTVVRSLLKKQS